MRGSKNSSGYTLLEILLVLTILAGTGFYLFFQTSKDLQEQGIEIASQRLLDDLREVQQSAIAENVWYKVKFYPDTKEYMIFRQAEFFRAVTLPEGVNFGNPPVELTFLPTGAPVPGMTVILKSGKRVRNIVIAPVMGRIRLEIVR